MVGFGVVGYGSFEKRFVGGLLFGGGCGGVGGCLGFVGVV